MKKKYSIEGTFQVNGSEEKRFEIEYDNLPENEENNNKLLQLLHHPWRLIKEGGKLGVKGVRRFFAVLFLFSLTNTILFFYSISRLFSTEFEFNKILFVLLVLLLGLAITIYSAYRTYQFVIIDTMRVIYENLSSFFQKISERIVDKAESKFKGQVDLTKDQVAKALDLGKMVNSRYQSAPGFLRRGILMILKRVPFAGMLMDLKDEISQGNKAEASAKLYTKMDGFITNSIFGNNHTRWVWLLWPLNILILALIIQYKIA